MKFGGPNSATKFPPLFAPALRVKATFQYPVRGDRVFAPYYASNACFERYLAIPLETGARQVPTENPNLTFPLLALQL